MSSGRKKGKRLWGGYLEPEEFEALDRCATRYGFATRTDFLAWFGQNCERLAALDLRFMLQGRRDQEAQRKEREDKDALN